MVRLGKVYGNRMVDVAVTNAKLEDRALRILRDLAGIERGQGQALLQQSEGSVKLALLMAATGLGASALNFADGVLVNSELGDLPSQFVSATVLAVPEPGTWLMLGLGLAAVAGAARRRSA